MTGAGRSECGLVVSIAITSAVIFSAVSVVSRASSAERAERIELNGQSYLIVEQSRECWANRTRAFNESARKALAIERVADCRDVIDVPVGTADGNHSFGAVCARADDRSRLPVMICNDEMVGHFKVAPVTKEPTRRQLAEFVGANCFGG